MASYMPYPMLSSHYVLTTDHIDMPTMMRSYTVHATCVQIMIVDNFGLRPFAKFSNLQLGIRAQRGTSL